MLKSKHIRNILLCLTLLMSILSQNFTSYASDSNTSQKKILYINAYHTGYDWSDDIQSAIEAEFYQNAIDVDLDVIYLDTKRLLIADEGSYFSALAETIQVRNNTLSYDLIMASDDAAYQFANQYLDFIDYKVPLVFCGINDIESVDQTLRRPYGGTVEYIDLNDTISLIGQLHPNTKTIKYIVDDTLTGKSIEKSLLKEYDLNHPYEFEKLVSRDMSDLLEQVENLTDDTVLLYTVYFYNKHGDYYSSAESTELIANASNVPMYGLWETVLGSGIVGGKLLSGIDQGGLIAQMAIAYFEQGEEALDVVIENNNRYQFDYEYMKKYEVNVDVIPAFSDIINYETSSYKNVLILHSYNPEFQWTNTIDSGIKDVLNQYSGDLEIYTEYMDLKRIVNPLYTYQFQQLFEVAHDDKIFDLIITSDDAAFNYAKDYVRLNKWDVPIIFCGVNYLDEEDIEQHKNYSGVIEAYDIRGTIETILTLQPEVSKVYVINDQSTTGQGNKLNVKTIDDSGEYPLDFIYTSNMTMTELLLDVSRLEKDTAILLMTFNRDRSNNIFSYERSINIIHEKANVPMYGVWDFYLGSGIVGGFLTDGYGQGQIAGEMGIRVLDGQAINDIEIVRNSPNQHKFDMNVIKEHKLNHKLIPRDAIVINDREDFGDIYKRNPNLFNIIIVFTFAILLILLLLTHYLRKMVVLKNKISILAKNDHLTGIYNRGAGIDALEEWVKDASKKGLYASIYFMDLDSLKSVNDYYGHSEGDYFITKISDTIAMLLKDEDIFCRIGGDEFMVAKLSNEHEDNEVFIRQVKIELVQLSAAEQKPYDFSVSIGAHQFILDGNVDVSEVIEIADTNMYIDKKNKR